MTGTATALTLKEAAAKAGVGKSTVHRAIVSGRLSVTRTEAGSIRVEESELLRVFQPGSSRSVPAGQNPKGQEDQRDGIVMALERENAILREVIDDLKRERDKWSDQAARLALAPPKSPRPWWLPWG